MSELCLSNTPKNQLLALFLSDFNFLCSLILSHPLYFSYIIFFSPYLLKLLSFLSPLFITTSLLLFSLLTIHTFPHNLTASKQGFFLSVYQTITEKLPKIDHEQEEDFKVFEEFEVYKIVFDTSSFDVIDNCIHSEEDQEKPGKVLEVEYSNSPDEMPLENFFKELDDFEKIPIMEEKKDTIPDDTLRVANNERILPIKESNLGTYGSMRKEKEWKRTLACKLFEERHNVGGDEGMDSLWETYEVDSSKEKQKRDTKKKNSKKMGAEFLEDNESEFDYEEDEERNVQLCCLQALKFSAGKMNLGMGRPNLVKFSKALKGIGWLHHVSKNSKKR
ncbi:hypothetical protein LguiB_000498 [Lonicera macranthoides]